MQAQRTLSQSQNQVKRIVDTLSQLKKQIKEKAFGKHCIFFLGFTGCGKSTLINGLIGNRMNATKVGVRISIDNYGRKPQIGNSSTQSQTQSPQFYQSSIKGTYLTDCPGFSDTRGYDIDIFNFHSIRYTLHYCASYRIVLVLSMEMFQQRSQNLIRTLKNISSAFSKYNENLFVIGITSASSDDTTKDIKQSLKTILKELQQKKQVGNAQRNLYKFLTEEKTPIFLIPKAKIGSYQIPSQFKQQVLKSKQPFQRNSFNPAKFSFLKPESKEAILKLINKLSQESQIVKNDKKNSETVSHILLQKRKDLQEDKQKPNDIIKSLKIQRLSEGGGISIKINGKDYPIGKSVSEYSSLLEETPEYSKLKHFFLGLIPALATQMSTLALCACISLLSNPIGLGVGAILSVGSGMGMAKYYSDSYERYIVNMKAQRKEKAKDFLNELLQIVNNTIKANNDILQGINGLKRFCQQMVEEK